MKCIVVGCTHNSASRNNTNNQKTDNKYRFYRFPKDRELQKQWLHFCGRSDDINMETARVCHVHFLPENFERNLKFEMGFTTKNGYLLKSDVVPSLEPAKEDWANEESKKSKQHKRTETTKTMTNWHMWCRLCAKEDPLNNVDIFYKEPSTSDSMIELDSISDPGGHSKLARINGFIEKCFSIKILPDDELPKTLCSECITIITELESFAELVNNAQTMFLTLQNKSTKSLDLHKMRLKYKLSESSSKQQMAGIFKQRTKSSELEEDLMECNMPTVIEYNDPLEKPNTSLEKDIEEEEMLEEELIESKHSETFNDVEHNDVVHNKLEAEDEAILHDVEINADEIEKELTAVNPVQISLDKAKVLTEKDINEILNDLRMERAAQRLKSRQMITCHKCARIFTNQYLYERHAKTHLPKVVKNTLTCPHCDKKFPTKYVLDNHIAFVHKNEKRFVCHECGLLLKSKGNLRGHMKTHSDTMRFNCEICSKGFNRRDGYEGHMDTHNTDEKFICPKCGKMLNSRHTLKNHMVVHSDVRKLECDYCKKTFKHSRNFKGHLLLHTGIKPYACKFCDRTFACKSSHYCHEKKVHAKEAAALKANGGEVIPPNVPKLSTLKAIIKTGNNLRPITYKQRKDKQLDPLASNDIESLIDVTYELIEA